MSQAPTIPDLDEELRILLDEETNPEKACELKVYVAPGVNEPCPNQAVFKVGLIKPCGHVSDIYLCEQCWTRTVILAGAITWRCKHKTETGPCDTSYAVPPAVVSVDRIR